VRRFHREPVHAILQRIDGSDALNEWTTTIGSSIWAMPGGFPADGWLAQGLFDA